MPSALARPIHPMRVCAGNELAVGTYHVVDVSDGFTVACTIGLARWYPLTALERPAWRLWSTFHEAAQWVEDQSEDLSDYPFWGR